MNELLGPQGKTTSKVSLADLSKLRNATSPPDLAGLQQLGQAVIESIMPPQVLLGFKVCIAQAQNNKRGLRLVVSLTGNTSSTTGIRIHELPLEAAFNNTLDFISTNVQTPVSRGVTVEADRDAVKVAPPLRILIIASEPSDMPPVNAKDEKVAILKALKPLIDSRAVIVDFCDPPTLMQLDAKLQKEVYHIVHFIGHGDFELAGLDPTPQPHLYFEDGTPIRGRHAADIGRLYPVLRNGNVPLVVLTACSTAAASPNGSDYPVIAFDSIAKTLVERQSGPSAVVAMQFDFETQAAEVFSNILYEKLLTPGWSLDQAVSAARVALISKLGPGHRSWINPTIYWRFKEGRVFDFLDTIGNLTSEQQNELSTIKALIDEYEGILNELSQASQEEQVATAGLRGKWQAKIQELLVRRGLVLGDTIRLRGGLIKPDGTIECALTIQLRLPATVGDVRAIVKHDPVVFDLIGNAPGANVLPESVFVQSNADQSTVVLIQNASQGVGWQSGEKELATLKFRLKNPASKPFFYIPLASAKVNQNGVTKDFQTLNAAIFGS
jgi:hypothetical protein